MIGWGVHCSLSSTIRPNATVLEYFLPLLLVPVRQNKSYSLVLCWQKLWLPPICFYKYNYCKHGLTSSNSCGSRFPLHCSPGDSTADGRDVEQWHRSCRLLMTCKCRTWHSCVMLHSMSYLDEPSKIRFWLVLQKPFLWQFPVRRVAKSQEWKWHAVLLAFK